MGREVHKKDWWFGPEVEGQFADGRRTAIIRRPAPGSPAFTGGVAGATVEHVFLTEDFDAWEWFEVFAREFPGTMAVGVRYDDVARLTRINELECRPRLHVLLRFFGYDARGLDLLQAHDEVSVGAPFNLFTFPVPAGVRTVPADYEDDV